jgi:hypothetical protein
MSRTDREVCAAFTNYSARYTRGIPARCAETCLLALAFLLSHCSDRTAASRAPSVGVPDGASDGAQCVGRFEPLAAGVCASDDEAQLCGTGQGRSVAEAVVQARVDAAYSAGVMLRSTEVSNILIQRGQGKEESTRLLRLYANAVTEQFLAGCKRVDTWCGASGEYHAMVKCNDADAMLRQELRVSAQRIVDSLASNVVLMILPGVDEVGRTTALGAHIAAILQTELQDTVRKTDTKRVTFVNGRHDDLDTDAPGSNVTDFVRTVHFGAEGARVHIKTFVVRASRDQEVVAGANDFYAAFSPGQLQALLVPYRRLYRDAYELATDYARARAEVHLENSRLIAGTTLKVRFRIPREAYVYLLDIWDDGRVGVLLPHRFPPDNLYSAGVWHTIPDERTSTPDERMVGCLPDGRTSASSGTFKLLALPRPLSQLGLPAFDGGRARVCSDELCLFVPGPRSPIRALQHVLETLRSDPVFADGAVDYTVLANPSGESLCSRVPPP